MRNRLLKLCLGGFLFGIFCSTVWVATALTEPLEGLSEDKLLQVAAGDSLTRVLIRASEENWLPNPRLVSLWARFNNIDRSMKAGEYRVPAGSNALDLLTLLEEGEVITYRVTLPEGITLEEAINRLNATPNLVSTLSGPFDPSLLAITEMAGSAEGWFLPETYQFIAGNSDLDILKRAHDAMQQALELAWNERAPVVAVKSPYETLILASIIERETSVGSERKRISGVFSRRLQRGMRLQTDPTVIYGLGNAYDGNLTRAHLRDESNDWNTYQIFGLPPTPIALPGLASIEAALHPDQSDSLYFVGRGDGHHAFADTLDQHNENVRRYQLDRRADYRSTPASNKDSP